MSNLDRIRKKMKPERRRKIIARGTAIMAKEMTLRDLRTALTRTPSGLLSKPFPPYGACLYSLICATYFEFFPLQAVRAKGM